ncbi:MAG: S8 family serine peptidase [Bacilli bacterium]|nr:S8 family serine peptidase [Bacilli bacterium]
MKKAALLTLLACAFSFSALLSLKNSNFSNEEKDATIIVKMKGDVNKYSHDSLIKQQNYLLQQISNNITHNYQVKGRYSHLFNGFILNVPSTYVEDIRQLDLVDEIDYNNFLCYEESFDDGTDYEVTSISTASASSQTMEKPEGTNDGAGTFVAILDNSFYIRTTFGRQSYHHVFAALNNEDIYVTQNSLKAKIDAASSFHGKYDRSHTTYYNNKVPFYYDYGGDKSNSVTPDYDVYAEGQSHGSHVASIAAGNAGEEYEGIAPRAQLALMKVFTTYLNGSTYVSGAYQSAVLNALEDCLVLEVDAINMSFGSNLNDFDDNQILESTIKELNDRGTFVDVAAGNDGKGLWNNSAYRYWQSDMVETGTLSTYANNLSAMTIASGQPDYQFYGAAMTIDGTNVQFSDQVTNYTSSSGDVTYEPERHLMDLSTTYSRDEFDFVYLPGLGKDEEYDGIDANDKIVITNRGENTFREKVDNAINHGAIAVGIIDNVYETDFNIRMSFSSDDTTYTPSVPVIFILNRDKEVFENSTSMKLKLIKNKDLDNPNARTMSDFSSDGMRYDLSIKPEIATPGSNIKGAVLGATNKYESMSGTSMAAPNYTGAVALLIGEHLNDDSYRSSINARLMSTAHPMLDTTSEHNIASVRRQGAGMINLDGALNSSVYLDGLDEDNQQIGKAKIELFNNEDIAKGDINLSFAAINESEDVITYEAHTYVMAPAIAEMDAKDYPELADKKLQSINNQLVELYNEEVTVNPGFNKVNITHSLSEDKLALLDEEFPTGCILEGYIILTAVNKPQLSIPFLGYYGDLEAVSPVEPFDFEKDENKAYQSDLLNTYALHTTKGTPIDFGSHILSGYWSNVKTAGLENIFKKNTMNISEVEDDNQRVLNKLGYNPYTGKYDASTLYVSNNHLSNTLIIQQTVLRSVKDNQVKVIDKKTGEVVISDYLTDSLNSSSSLYKSHLDMSIYASGNVAHRAYCIMSINSLVEGDYELVFNYVLSAGSTYVKKIDLTITNEAPALQSVEQVKVDQQDYYRFAYEGSDLAFVNYDGQSYEIKKQDDVASALIPASKLGEKEYGYIESIDYLNHKNIALFNTSNNNFVVLSNHSNQVGYILRYDISGKGTNYQVFNFSIVKDDEEINLSDKNSYYMLLPDGLDLESLEIFEQDNNGEENRIEFTYENNMLSFESDCWMFAFESDAIKKENEETEEEKTVYLKNISITKPNKLTYNIGEELDLTGLTVTAIYSDGSTVILKEGEYHVSEVDMSVTGKKTINVVYSGLITAFTITVNNPASKSGCSGSTVASVPLLIMLSAFGAALIIRRKKEQ